MLSFLAIVFCASARRVGAYCYFANTGSELYEDDNVKLVLTLEKGDVVLAIYNKTDQVIYVDKANTFAYTNGTPEMLFKNTAQTTNNTSSGGASLNLGGVANALGVGGIAGGLLSGVTVGGGNSSQSGTIVYEQRVIPVAPLSINVLYKWSDIKEHFSDALVKVNPTWSTFRGRFIDPSTGYEEMFDKGMSRSYTESVTPFSVMGVVKYATDENFEKATQAKVFNYVSDIVIDSYKGVKDPNYSLPYCMQIKNRRADYAFKMGESGAMHAFAKASTVLISGGVVAMIVLLSML